MVDDPFTTTSSELAALAPRAGVEASDEADLLPAMLREVQSFATRHVDGAAIDARGSLGPELLRELGARGWFGLTVPEAQGGAGLSLAAATRIVSELAFHNGSVGTCVGLHSGLALHALLHLGSPGLRERYLPEIARGQRIAAFAATEPGAGSDISAVSTRLGEHQGRLRLDGSKCYVTNGGLAGLVTVLAKSPGLGGARAGHTLVLVDPAWSGVTPSREEHKLGLKGSSTCTLDFENVTVPPDHVLGELSHGLEHAHRALTWGRTFMAAGCLGSARAAIVEASAHTRTRQQFGRPLVHFPLVRDALARARAQVYAVESALRLVCALGDTGADLALPSSFLKVLASESAWNVIDTCLQLMGGAGYMEDNGMARRLRDVRVTRIFEGANDVLRTSVAAAALAWHPPRLAELSWSSTLAARLPEEARTFHATFGELARTLAALKKRWGFRLFEQQAVAVDLADALIASFAALAVLIRASRDPSPGELALARLAARTELARAARSLGRAAEGPDPTETALLSQLCER